MVRNKAGRRYTTALYEAAKDMKLLDQTEQDFLDMESMIEQSRELKLFLLSPIINPVKKHKIIREIFSGRVSDLTMRFIDILCERRREGLLYDICLDYQELLNQKRGIAEARIKTSIEIPEAGKKALVERLRKYTGKEIKPVFKLDKDIKGGFVAQVNDTIIDASIKRQLEMMREKLVTIRN
jgi:F-type H+-transporting ATPase subunit delta